MTGRLFQIGSRTGKKKREKKVDFFEIYAVFDNERNFEAFSENTAEVITNVLNKELKVDYDWESNEVKLTSKNKKPLLSKTKQQTQVTVKKWRDKIHKNIIGKFDVETTIDSENGVIKVYLL